MANNNIIYKITSKTNGKIYVGSALNYSLRIKKHLNSLKINTHHNVILQNHFNKYGIEDLEFSIIEIVEQKENLVSREQHYIDTLKPEFNICPTAGSALGRKWSESMRSKMTGRTSFWKGKKLSQETKRKMSESRKGKKPYIMTDETKRKISKYVTENPVRYWIGKKRTKEDVEKIRNSKIGKKASQETKNRMSISQTGLKKKKHSLEANLRQSLRMIGSKRGKYKKISNG